MGEAAIFRMLSDFYAELGCPPHPADVSGRPGGILQKIGQVLRPIARWSPLFNEQHGPPRLRARHLPFAIDENARLVWVACFEKTLENAGAQYGFPPQHLEGFRVFLGEFSKWMVNRK